MRNVFLILIGFLLGGILIAILSTPTHIVERMFTDGAVVTEITTKSRQLNGYTHEQYYILKLCDTINESSCVDIETSTHYPIKTKLRLKP